MKGDCFNGVPRYLLPLTKFQTRAANLKLALQVASPKPEKNFIFPVLVFPWAFRIFA